MLFHLVQKSSQLAFKFLKKKGKLGLRLGLVEIKLTEFWVLVELYFWGEYGHLVLSDKFFLSYLVDWLGGCFMNQFKDRLIQYSDIYYCTML